MQTDWISKWAGYAPIKTAVRDADSGNDLTYSQLHSLSAYLGEKLEKLSIGKGDRVVILSEFRLELIVLLGVAMKKGIILVPLNYRLSAREIAHMFGDCEPKAVFLEKQFSHLIDERLLEYPAAHQFDMDALGAELHAISDQEFQGVSTALTEDDPLFILYTSGTTGFPKGAIYTHKMALWNAINTQLRLDVTSQDHTIICMPPFHTGGWNVLLIPFLFHGASFTLLKKFDASQVLALLEDEEASLFMGVPTMLKMMMDADNFEKVTLDKLRYMVVGGEAMPLPLIEFWEKKGIPIRQGFGLTEVGPNVFSLHHDDAIRKIGSIGTPNFFFEVKLMKQNGEEAGSQEEGELWLKSPTSTPGYWQNDEATREAFSDGWFKTGDVLVRDEEGYYYVKDRIKNMFISGGENVYPAEVERFLQTNPAIDEVAVVGVPDDRWGEVGKAIIVRSEESVSEEAILDFCAGKLAKFKIPKQIHFVDSIPKTDSGKIDRKKLKAME